FGSPHSFSRTRTCGRTIFDSLAGEGERTCGFRTVDGAPSRVNTAQPLRLRKPGRFNRPCARPAARPANFRSNRRRLAGTTLRQATMRATSCGRRMPVRSREAMRTPAWLRTARPSAFVAVTMAGWPRWSLTFGSSLTQVRILAGEGCVRDQSRAGPCESCSLVVLVLCTGDATDRGAGIFLDVVDDLDRSGLLEHQRTLDLLANRERLLEAEQHDAKRAGLELDGLAGLDLDAVGDRARLGHAVHNDPLVHLDLARRRRGPSDQAIRGLSLVGDGEIAA